MVSGLLIFVIFVLALGGMIFLHELGHFLASRWAGVEVEEFGFGFPPRALGFWRSRGFLIFDRKRIEIPQNFGRIFDWQALASQPAKVTVDQVDNRYILRTLEFVHEETTPRRPAMNREQIAVNTQGQVVEASEQATSSSRTVKLGTQRGMIEWDSVVDEVHPGTLFSLNWLPLGGFVRPKGENDPAVPGGLAAASPWKRLVVLFAGPIMNLLTAVVVFSLLIAMEGMPTRGPIQVQDISSDSPAEQAGLQSGDSIIAMNGKEITGVTQAIEIIQSNLDEPVQIKLKRGNEEMTITATPLSSRSKEQGALGISLSPATRPASAGEVLSGGVTITAYQVASIAYLPVALVQGVIDPGEARVIGFKGIYDLFGIAVQEDVQTRQEPPADTGTTERPSNWTLNLIGVLSVSLGVMNLLPIPALDGGRILFTLPEILFRKRIPTEWENVVNGMAMLLLIALMVFINVMDFVNPAALPTP